MKRFTVVLFYTKEDSEITQMSLFHSVRDANSKEEAFGMAVNDADKQFVKDKKTGYSIKIKSVLEIPNE